MSLALFFAAQHVSTQAPEDECTSIRNIKNKASDISWSIFIQHILCSVTFFFENRAVSVTM